MRDPPNWTAVQSGSDGSAAVQIRVICVASTRVAVSGVAELHGLRRGGRPGRRGSRTPAGAGDALLRGDMTPATAPSHLRIGVPAGRQDRVSGCEWSRLGRADQVVRAGLTRLELAGWSAAWAVTRHRRRQVSEMGLFAPGAEKG